MHAVGGAVGAMHSTAAGAVWYGLVQDRRMSLSQDQTAQPSRCCWVPCPAPPPPGAAAATVVVEPGYILSTVARKNILIVTITVVVTARMVLGLAVLCAGGMQPATGAGVRLVLSVVCLTTEATSHTAPPAAACLLLLLGMADHLGTQQGMWGVGCMQCCVSWRWCELVGCTQQ